jgi:hypothetical protein
MGSGMRAREPRGFNWNFHFDLPDGCIYTPKALARERNCAWQVCWFSLKWNEMRASASPAHPFYTARRSLPDDTGGADSLSGFRGDSYHLIVDVTSPKLL